jgi:hypothetical protein
MYLLQMISTPNHITQLEPNQVFVFGNNKSGWHKGGAAKLAMQWGAKWECTEGLQGSTYAIPTKGFGAISTLSVEDIKPYVDQFIIEAKQMPQKEFLVTEIGCGKAGLKAVEIAPLFQEAIGSNNIRLPEKFIEILKGTVPIILNCGH